jgi:hypothetical protein
MFFLSAQYLYTGRLTSNEYDLDTLTQLMDAANQYVLVGLKGLVGWMLQVRAVRRFGGMLSRMLFV